MLHRRVDVLNGRNLNKENVLGMAIWELTECSESVIATQCVMFDFNAFMGIVPVGFAHTAIAWIVNDIISVALAPCDAHPMTVFFDGNDHRTPAVQFIVNDVFRVIAPCAARTDISCSNVPNDAVA